MRGDRLVSHLLILVPSLWCLLTACFGDVMLLQVFLCLTTCRLQLLLLFLLQVCQPLSFCGCIINFSPILIESAYLPHLKDLPFLAYDNVDHEELGCNFVPLILAVGITSSCASALAVPCKVTLLSFPNSALRAHVYFTTCSSSSDCF